MDLLRTKQINMFSFLFSAAANACAAVLLFRNDNWLMSLFPYIFIGIFAFNTLKCFLSLFINNEEEKEGKFIEMFVNAAMLVLFIVYPWLYMPLLSLAVGVYILIIAFVNLYSAYLYSKNNVSSAYIRLFVSMACLFFGIWLMLSPLVHAASLKEIVAWYFAFMAFSDLGEFIEQLIPEKFLEKLREGGLKRILTPAPTFVSAFVPARFLKQLKKYLIKNGSKETDDLQKFKTDELPTIEVFMHVFDRPAGRFGHIDIAYRGKVFTYGNYDESTYHLGGMAGDGVFEVVDRGKYLAFSISNFKKTIVSYGIHLSEKQEELFREKLKDIFKNLIPWKSCAERDSEENLPEKEYTDYASKIYRAARAKMYKLKKGKYKSYFSLNTNCAKWADEILSSFGLCAFRIAWIVTPGMYYEFLNHEFKKAHSQVISREILTQSSLPVL